MRRSIESKGGPEVGALPRPYFVWEPMEHSCSSENLKDFFNVLPCVDTFSPNEDEFAKLLNMQHQRTGTLSLEEIGDLCQMILTRCPIVQFEAIVVRLGARGALVAQRENRRNQWLPAYHGLDPSNITPSKVVDVTGGGNAFMGGFCAGLVAANPIKGCTRRESAAMFGVVAASFAIEQIGMPKVEASADGVEGPGHARLNEYLEKVETLT